MQEGETAIIFAARNGHVDIVKLLMENGAVVDHKNKVTDFQLGVLKIMLNRNNLTLML